MEFTQTITPNIYDVFDGQLRGWVYDWTTTNAEIVQSNDGSLYVKVGTEKRSRNRTKKTVEPETFWICLASRKQVDTTTMDVDSFQVVQPEDQGYQNESTPLLKVVRSAGNKKHKMPHIAGGGTITESGWTDYAIQSRHTDYTFRITSEEKFVAKLYIGFGILVLRSKSMVKVADVTSITGAFPSPVQFESWCTIL